MIAFLSLSKREERENNSTYFLFDSGFLKCMLAAFILYLGAAEDRYDRSIQENYQAPPGFVGQAKGNPLVRSRKSSIYVPAHAQDIVGGGGGGGS